MEPETREQDDKAVARLLESLGGIFLAVGGKDMLGSIAAHSPVNTGSAVISCIGAVLLIFGVFWHKIRPSSETKFTRSLSKLASDARSWYLPLVGFGLYIMVTNVLFEVRQNNEIVALRNDVQSITHVIERGLMPRHLSKWQQKTISDFLLQFQPHDIAFKLALRDEEAAQFGNDIHQALEKAGWKLADKEPFIYADDVPNGLTINFMQTQEHNRMPEDPRNPRPDKMLVIALGLAGVRFAGTGGGTGVSVTDDRLVIGIGHRRMDYDVILNPDFPFLY